MQVSVEQTSELSRKMTVSIPEKIVQDKVNAKLKSLTREAKIDGFRPGKVPQKVIEKRYGAGIKAEILTDLMQSSYPEALKDQNLNPASPPYVRRLEDSAINELVYTAEFEVYPEVSLENISSMAVVYPSSQIEESDNAAMLAKLQNQKKTWEVVERAAQEQDKVTLNLEGVCDGENFTDGKVTDFQVEIGSKQMIPGFEEQLIGLQVENNKSFNITFPEDYINEDLAGKEATFTVDISKIESPILPEINTDFVKEYGIESGDLDTFYADVKSNMEQQLKQALHSKSKEVVLDGLYKAINLPLPVSLVDEEIDSMIKTAKEERKNQNLPVEDADFPREVFIEQAKKRVSLSLILSHIIQNNDIKLDNDKVRSMVESVSASYETPAEVIDWYYADESRLNDVRQVVLEDQVVAWITEQIQISYEQVNFYDLMNK